MVSQPFLVDATFAFHSSELLQVMTFFPANSA